MSTPEPFVIDHDIRRAWTPPARFYSDPRFYDLCRDRVFAPSWQFIGDTDDLKVPGQVQPLTLLEGLLDEPLLLTRDASDRIHLVSNVCTHRGMLVCEGASNERFLRCRYHGRRFGLDGKFQAMPEFEACENFPSERDDLAPVPFHALGKFLFASLEPRATFDDVFAPILDRVGWLPFHAFLREPTRTRDYLVRANWALYVENYLEGFHIPFIHASLNDVIDYSTYTTELFRYSNLQVAYGGDVADTFVLPDDSVDAGRAVSAYYFWIFPNTMLNFYPWGLSVNVVRPLGSDLTRVSFIGYVWDRSKMDVGAGGDLDRVEREDEAVVEMVQRGLRSRIYDRGRYSPTKETGTHHFHRLLTESLFGS